MSDFMKVKDEPMSSAAVVQAPKNATVDAKSVVQPENAVADANPAVEQTQITTENCNKSCAFHDNCRRDLTEKDLVMTVGTGNSPKLKTQTVFKDFKPRNASMVLQELMQKEKIKLSFNRESFISVPVHKGHIHRVNVTVKGRTLSADGPSIVKAKEAVCGKVLRYMFLENLIEVKRELVKGNSDAPMNQRWSHFTSYGTSLMLKSYDINPYSMDFKSQLCGSNDTSIHQNNSIPVNMSALMKLNEIWPDNGMEVYDDKHACLRNKFIAKIQTTGKTYTATAPSKKLAKHKLALELLRMMGVP